MSNSAKNNHWFEDLSIEERKTMTEEINSLAANIETGDDIDALLETIRQWQLRAQTKTLRQIWNNNEPMPEDEAMQLALQAQHQARVDLYND